MAALKKHLLHPKPVFHASHTYTTASFMSGFRSLGITHVILTEDGVCSDLISLEQCKARYQLRVIGLAFRSTLTFTPLDHEMFGSNITGGNLLSNLNDEIWYHYLMKVFFLFRDLRKHNNAKFWMISMNFQLEFYFQAEMYFILINTKKEYFRIIFYPLIFKKVLQVKNKWISIEKTFK